MAACAGPFLAAGCDGAEQGGLGCMEGGMGQSRCFGMHSWRDEAEQEHRGARRCASGIAARMHSLLKAGNFYCWSADAKHV